MPQAAAERMEFKTEVNQLLDLVVHSLYSHKDIFLRELISNASDAIDKLRYLSLTNPDLAAAGGDWRIRLTVDKTLHTLTVSDNGIGMTHEELIEHLGTIAKSGTKEFLARLQKTQDAVNLIGQFGVGFYSAFMVADRVEVVTRSPQGSAFRWSSDGKQGFEVAPAEKPERGTDVVLHLKPESHEYLEEHELRALVKKYSDFVEFPVELEVERTHTPLDSEGKPVAGAKPEIRREMEVLNSRKAIWSKPKQQVAPEEYKEFYQHLSHEFGDPLETIHYSAEGTLEFKALLFIPAAAPMDLFAQDGQRGLQLHINRVFIMTDARKLIPPYLRFLKGVVDTTDLPLNVSREMLQQNDQLEKINRNLVSKVLAVLKEMKEKEYEKYLKFYRMFGQVLKEGLHYEHEKREAIAELLLFESNRAAAGTYRSFDQYVQDMKPGQKTIYYLTAEDRNQALASPRLEGYQAKEWEVLFMLEPIDELVMNDLFEYKQKPLSSIQHAEMETGEEEKKTLETERKEAEEKFRDVAAAFRKQFEAEIQEVRFSPRLNESPACLISEDFGLNKGLREMWKAMGRELPPQKFILELNPKHRLIGILAERLAKDPADPKAADYIQWIHDQALLGAGLKLKDVGAFAKRLNRLLVDSAG